MSEAQRLRERKELLERQLAELIQEFSESTGLAVISVEMTKWHRSVDGEVTYAHTAKVTAQL